MSIREQVQDLASQYGIAASDDHASSLADQFNRIEGVEGDETLALIATLMRAGVVTDEEGTALVIRYSDELDQSTS